MGLAFQVVPSRIDDETGYIDVSRLEAALGELATAKARAVADRRPGALVLGADTVVVCDKAILGKPSGRADALSMLRKLSGRAHDVYSGVALVCAENSFCATAVERTSVFFGPLSDEDIGEYLDTGEHADKAGAYGIQGRAMVFVEKIEGCYYNVVGLPAAATVGLFREYASRKDRSHG